MDSSPFQLTLRSYVAFSAQPGIYLSTLGGFRLPHPPLAEQNRIATLIGEQSKLTDKLIAAEQATVERLREYRQALVSAAVTGKLDIPAETAA